MSATGRGTLALVFVGVLVSCGQSLPAELHEAPGDEREAIAITTWTEDTELFVEFPVLVVGLESPFAAHLTWLDGFAPVASGEVAVVLSGGGAADEHFTSEPSATPGIFRPLVQPAHATRRQVTVVLKSDTHRSEHRLGAFTVLSTLPDGPPEQVEDAGSISFLKEQQWKMRFSTEIVETRSLQSSLSAYGTLIPRADGEVIVSAPATGRLAASTPLPVVGSTVKSGDLLARLTPRLEGRADVASLDLAVAAARLDLDHSVRERERLEGLLAEGAVPKRRVVQARHAEASARAALDAARGRVRQHQRVQRPRGGGAQGIEVRAPLSGSIFEVSALAGSFVEDGAPLVRIVDPTSLWLSAQVPEIDAARIAEIRGAWFQVPGIDAPFELDLSALISRGVLVDPRTFTIDVLFSVPNEAGLLRVGTAVHAHLTLGERVEVPSVPARAVLVDAGLDYVFVQTGGESFERRQVQRGIRDGSFVEIIEGVVAGERVVGDGAYAVKLASASTSPPAHGHAH